MQPAFQKMKPSMHDESSQGTLQGIKVLDFSRMLPGPWCAQMLGDLGADVIKVEQPGVGDLGRHNPPNYKQGSVYFNTVNIGKRSVVLDLTDAVDRKKAHEMIAQADVIVESFRRGVTQRLQIDYETAKKINPGIVYCSITGFGQTGPWADIPGHDLVVQSVSGVMGTGPEGELPPVPGFQAADYAAAAYGIAAVLAALYRKKSTGQGCNLDISMFDCLFSMTNVIAGAALARAGGFSVTSIMELYGANPRYATYQTKDRKAVAVSLLEARIWKSFCDLIGRPDLVLTDEGPEHRHTVHGDRANLYREAIAEVCMSRPRDELVRWMIENNVPILPVYTPDETVQSDHVAARGLVEWLSDPNEGRIPVLANPLARSGLTRENRRPAPMLGGHQEILNQTGAFTWTTQSPQRQEIP
jgi:crotonobetainyl-CoA:carnitine CoA-transferase CaiB-like acyl-CoA transferase